MKASTSESKTCQWAWEEEPSSSRVISKADMKVVGLVNPEKGEPLWTFHKILVLQVSAKAKGPSVIPYFQEQSIRGILLVMIPSPEIWRYQFLLSSKKDTQERLRSHNIKSKLHTFRTTIDRHSTRKGDNSEVCLTRWKVINWWLKYQDMNGWRVTLSKKPWINSRASLKQAEDQSQKLMITISSRPSSRKVSIGGKILIRLLSKRAELFKKERNKLAFIFTWKVCSYQPAWKTNKLVLKNIKRNGLERSKFTTKI